MEITSWWQILVSVIGGLGGLEFIKWLFNRKANSRIKIAEAGSAEFHTLQETVQFLQEQLQSKEEKFAEQTALVRQLNRELLTAERAIAEKDVELVQKKCEDLPCPFRKPPNALTQPKPGVTKEQYQEAKLLPPTI